ncbi:MAG: putative porin [Proteobacteria bacterium]|nr:putative porin [Pseudomonadota bacterium]
MKSASLAALLCAASVLIASPASAAEQSWVDRIRFKGDVRLRYESIDEEFAAKRERMRFRARFGFTADVRDDLQVVLQLASGGDNPVSTNQTFDDGFSRKDIGLDLAYVDWRVNESLTIQAGKMKNPVFKAGKVPLIWDSDLNPEGFAARFRSDRMFGTVAIFSVEERSSADDSLLTVVQAGAKFALGEAWKLTVGAGYFAYSNTVGNRPFYNGKARGNSVDTDGDYLFEYKDTEVFAQVESTFYDLPLQVFAHFAQNNAVSTQDKAFSLGIKLGSAKERGQYEFAWIYQDIEADAVIGTYNDSDFAGGGTDSRGHILKVKVGLARKIFFAGTLFVNAKDRFQDIEHDYTRVQIDIEFRFD